LSNTEDQRIYYPPGGLLIWIILTIELVTFIPALIAFFVYRADQTDQFASSASKLSLTIGTVNTVILITGGWLMAEALRYLRSERAEKAQLFLWLGTVSGLAFLGLKGYEYWNKLSQGFGLEHDDFFSMYWMITGFHYLHVLVGTGLLIVAALGIRRGSYNSDSHEDVETIGVFWHMCDLIWILVFPAIYILARGGA
tara:strand:- start:3051 stop:3641 length:591 start_codon:yes stop_codon:yes gene_type:complete